MIHAVDNAVTLGWLRSYLGRDPQPDELDPVTWDMAREGLELTAVDHAAAIDDLHAQARRAARAFESADVVLCPTLNVLPPKPGSLSASRGSVDAFFDVEFAATGWTAVANATGWAAISLPLGEADGLPVGVQLLAPDEAVLLRVAAQLELALPWVVADPRPTLTPDTLIGGTMTRALLLIDIQRDYFPGGAHPLVGSDAAAEAAASVLARFRGDGAPVLHVQHVWDAPEAEYLRPGTPGVEHDARVAPAEGEPVVVKEQPNAFLGTDLEQQLSADRSTSSWLRA